MKGCSYTFKRDNAFVLSLFLANFKRKFVGLFLFACIGFLFIQCRRIEPKAPMLSTDSVPPMEQRESIISLPIEINLLPYLKETEKNIPKSLVGDLNQCDGVSYAYVFEREPIAFEGKGKWLNYEVKGKYSLALNYCPECTYLFSENGTCIVPRIYVSCGIKEPKRRMSVAYATQFDIAPDLRFKAKTELKKFQLIDPCEVTVFNFNATNKLHQELSGVLRNLEKDIDAKIETIQIRKSVEDVWNQLSTPTKIQPYGYFSLSPKQIAVGPISFENTSAFFDLNLTVKPILSSKISKSTPPELPLLSKFKPTDGFDISLEIVADYDSLSALMNKEMAGKIVRIKKSNVVFDSVSIDGAQHEKLTIKVDFSGTRKGTMYLIGTPKLDINQQTLSFPDLQFDLKTKHVLLQSAKWLFNSKITDFLKTKASFDMRAQLKGVVNAIQQEMNREIQNGIFLSGKLNQMELDAIFPSADNLIVRVRAMGTLKLSM